MCMNRLINEVESLQNFKKESIKLNGDILQCFKGYLQYIDTKFSKYYILDFEGAHCNEMINRYLSSKEAFDDLQDRILEDEFFEFSNDLRFNMYLIVIVNKVGEVPIFRSIQSDFKFGRKLIFEETDVIDYFSMNSIMKRDNNKDYIKKLNEIRNKVLELQKQINCLQMYHKFIEDDIDKAKSRFFKLKGKNSCKNCNLQQANINDINNLCDYIKLKKYESKKIYEYKYNISNSVKIHNINVNINSIKSIYIKNYKNIDMDEALEFKRVNLLYGDNGAGKTTLVEAIEYALTGKINRGFFNDKNINDLEIKLTCINSDNNNIVFDDIDKYGDKCAKLWYNVDKDDLNRLFRQFNYFDVERAFVFALSTNNLLLSELFINDEMKGLLAFSSIIKNSFMINKIELEYERDKLAVVKNLPDIKKAELILKEKGYKDWNPLLCSKYADMIEKNRYEKKKKEKN